MLLDLGVGTVTMEVGARRGDVPFVFDVDTAGAVSTAGTNDGEFSEEVPVIGVGDGVSIGVDTGTVPFAPGVKVHVSGQSLMTKHSHSSGKERNSSLNSKSAASSISVDVSHEPQEVKLSTVGRQGALM